jgi:LmbE family N-acetylglucosaminyl deacetylase
MSNIKRVVSIGAHSLDAELMGGPLLLRYARQGAHVTCLHVTQGRLADPNATKEEC